MIDKKFYVDFEIAKRLKQIGFNEICDTAYQGALNIKKEIQDQYPGLSDDGYYELTVDGGGKLNFEQVYEKGVELSEMFNSNNRITQLYTHAICSAPLLLQVQEWLLKRHGLYILVDFRKLDCVAWYYRICDIFENELVDSSDEYFPDPLAATSEAIKSIIYKYI